MHTETGTPPASQPRAGSQLNAEVRPDRSSPGPGAQRQAGGATPPGAAGPRLPS